MKRVFHILAIVGFVFCSAPVVKADTKVPDSMDLVGQFKDINENEWVAFFKIKSIKAAIIAGNRISAR
jgi:hypothetical protein